MDLAWNVVFDLLEVRGLLRDGLFVERYTGIRSWVEGLIRYTVLDSCDVGVLFVPGPWTSWSSATTFWGRGPKSLFTVPG